MKPAPPPIDLEELQPRSASNQPQARLLWMRWTAVAVGVALLIWLPFEDTSAVLPLFFSGLICLLAAVRLTWTPGRQARVQRYLLAGLSAGACLPLLAVVLMVFKSGVHAHPNPDFTPAQIGGILSRTPFFALGGLLMGLGVGLWQRLKQRPFFE